MVSKMVSKMAVNFTFVAKTFLFKVDFLVISFAKPLVQLPSA